mmetsp:Transcript_1783/g.5468  ORF Transcript_1783/g.5468 Transcript_1783/m.5468 type:complete len:271 (-) Transcript_1783:442-1254(-)
MRSSLHRLPCTSITTRSRRCIGATAARTLFTEPSSKCGTPKFMSGLSIEFFSELAFDRNRPLRTAHSKTFRLLSSAYCGFFSRNQSSQSNVPSSGNRTGNRTSCLPSLGGAYAVTAESACAASCIIRQRKGSGTCGWGPKFTCTVMFLKVTVGNRVLPFKLSGNACGSAIRAPSLNIEIVLELELFSSRLRRTATVSPLPNLRETALRLRLNMRLPSESKHMLSSESPMMGIVPGVEKPMRRKLRGVGIRACVPTTSTAPVDSTILASNM